jgi:hypothetical protein
MRTIRAALRRALAARDRGRGRFPGCSCRVVDAHHVAPWASGGESTIDDLVSLRRVHHTLGHEGRWCVEMVHREPPAWTARAEARLSPEEIPERRFSLVSRWMARAWTRGAGGHALLEHARSYSRDASHGYRDTSRPA